MKWMCLLVFVVGVLGLSVTRADTKKLTDAELAKVFGGGNGKCAGFKDCGTADCIWNATNKRCEQCKSPSGKTTQYEACFPTDPNDPNYNCEEDTAQTGNCGELHLGPSSPSLCISVQGLPQCKSNNPGACSTHFKLKTGGIVCPPKSPPFP